ncbi:hypothetical protein [Saccharothrix sp. ST-888]|uniref:hypothetical protein n=1 Tax=Saccharothrix sp. ST-888 TaxID=1427391 RepID=UPI0018CE9537|nr:hypothetical protein [Saccharothrix sp. ST-888]
MRRRLPRLGPAPGRTVRDVRPVRRGVPLSCLNRLQLRNNRQMVDLADPSGALQLVGTLRNPIARFARLP